MSSNPTKYSIEKSSEWRCYHQPGRNQAWMYWPKEEMGICKDDAEKTLVVNLEKVETMEGGSLNRMKSTSSTQRGRRKLMARDERDEAGSSCHCRSVRMNPKLWSRLPQYITDTIYAKLPYVDFFRLRCVCRRWYSLVESHSFLEVNPGAPFPEPWFLVITRHFIRYLMYDASCKSWIWMRLPGFFKKSWTIGGYGCLLYAIIRENDQDLKVGTFDPRTKIWNELPPLLKPEKYIHLHGMIKQQREAEFYKLVIVSNPHQNMKSENSTTQVYDSLTNSWTISAAKIPKGRNGLFIENTICCNGSLYAYNEQQYEIDPETDSGEDGLLTLDFTIETWSWVAGVFPCETPLFQVFGLNMSRPTFHYGLFSWHGRIYAAAKNMKNIGRISFSIWQLEEAAHAWKEVDQMPWDLFNWLSNEQDYPNYSTGTLLVQHNSFQCRNLVLICGFLEEEDLPFKFVLYDLHKRKWHRLDVPLLLGLNLQTLESSDTTDSEYGSSETTCSSTSGSESSSTEPDAESPSTEQLLRELLDA